MNMRDNQIFRPLRHTAKVKKEECMKSSYRLYTEAFGIAK